MKLGYICKYTPLELLTGNGITPVRLNPTAPSFPTAEAKLHPNVCSYVKAVFETAGEAFESDPELSGIVLTSCCDSVKRLYDALTKEFPEKFFYILDVPRKGNDFAASLYAARIQEMLRALSEFSGTEFREDALAPVSEAEAITNPATDSLATSGALDSAVPDALSIGLMGARTDDSIRRLLTARGANILFDLTCTGASRKIAIDSRLQTYTFRLLNQLPCMRMLAATDRASLLDGFRDRLDGILYHTVKFCDNFSFEYADFKETLDLPVLQIETDCTDTAQGQLTTRVEAFLEELKMRRGARKSKTSQATDAKLPSNNPAAASSFQENPSTRKERPMYVLGIDSGSTSTNTVILNQDREIIAYDVIRTGAKSAESAERILTETLDKAGLARTDLARIVSTGYGRVSIPFADENVTEISCHGRGAHFLNPNVRTILDIGGQDSKAIKLDEAGNVIDFVMNDKCAAGTGRFLEAMARTLEIGIEELGPVSLQSREQVEISSMCTVFAESEVISLIALNKETADIAAGVHRAIAKKALGMLRKVGLTPTYMMTGGVAKNPGVVKVLEELLGSPLFIHEEPEIVGALGAALYALEQINS